MSNWRRAILAVFFLLLIPVYWIAYRAPAVGTVHDDGIYLVTAKALAEGKGYRIISLPNENAQTKYPVLFPALLAIAWKIFPKFPDNVFLIKTVPLVFAFLWFWMTYKLLKVEFDKSDITGWIVLFTAASPLVVFYSSTILSETLFSLLCAGTLYWLCHLERNQGVREGRIVLISSALAAAAILTRTAGIPLVFAGTLALFMKRRFRDGLQYFSISAILIVPWLLWQAANSPSYDKGSGYYSYSNYINWNILLNFAFEQKIIIILKNLMHTALYPNALLGIKWGIYGFAFSLTFTFLAFIGFLKDMRSGCTSVHLFLVLYMGMILIWAWPPLRFLIPIFPFMLLYAYKGFAQLCTYVTKFERVRIITIRSVAIVICICLGITLYRNTAITFEQDQVPIAYSVRDDWHELSSQLRWIRENSHKDSVVVGLLDPMIYLYTGRKAVRGIVVNPFSLWYSDKPKAPLGEVSGFANIVMDQRVNYIIRIPGQPFQEGPFYNDLLASVLQKYPGVLTKVYEGATSSYKIYEVDTERLQRALAIQKDNP